MIQDRFSEYGLPERTQPSDPTKRSHGSNFRVKKESPKINQEEQNQISLSDHLDDIKPSCSFDNEAIKLIQSETSEPFCNQQLKPEFIQESSSNPSDPSLCLRENQQYATDFETNQQKIPVSDHSEDFNPKTEVVAESNMNSETVPKKVDAWVQVDIYPRVEIKKEEPFSEPKPQMASETKKEINTESKNDPTPEQRFQAIPKKATAWGKVDFIPTGEEIKSQTPKSTQDSSQNNYEEETITSSSNKNNYTPSAQDKHNDESKFMKQSNLSETTPYRNERKDQPSSRFGKKDQPSSDSQPKKMGWFNCTKQPIK